MPLQSVRHPFSALFQFVQHLFLVEVPADFVDAINEHFDRLSLRARPDQRRSKGVWPTSCGDGTVPNSVFGLPKLIEGHDLEFADQPCPYLGCRMQAS